MPLKGDKKKDYQRDYMRKRRLLDPQPVRPQLERIKSDAVAREIDKKIIGADGNIIPEM